MILKKYSMKKSLPTILAILFLIVYEIIIVYFKIGQDFLNWQRTMGAGLIAVVGYYIGKLIIREPRAPEN